MDTRIVIAGAGLAGLALSKALNDHGIESSVIETRETPGGLFLHDMIPLNGVDIRDRIAALASDARIELGTTAVFLESGIWTVSSKGKSKPSRVISATGFRALSLGELAIYGERPSGVFGIQSAIDAATKGYNIGKKIVLYGFNHYSLMLAKYLTQETGARMLFVDQRMNSMLHERSEAEKFGEVLESRIVSLKGKNRIEKVLTDKGEVDADTLVICKFSPHNYLGGSIETVGNALLPIEDPMAIISLSEAIVEKMISKNRAKIESNIPCYPEAPAADGSFVAFLPRKEGNLFVNERKVNFASPYVRIQVSGEETIRVSFS